MATKTLADKINDLLSSGLTYKVISARADCADSTIYRIKSGDIENPSYSVGVAIDALHSNLRKKATTKLAVAMEA